MEVKYIYNVPEVERVIDGDTYILHVDMGFRIFGHVHIRLQGYSTPELREPRGVEAKNFMIALFMQADQIVIDSKNEQSFARWIADVYVDDKHVGEYLKEAGLSS